MLSCFKKQDMHKKTGSASIEADIDYCPFEVFNAGLKDLVKTNVS